MIGTLFSLNKTYSITSLHLSIKQHDYSLLRLLRCCPALENVSLNVHGTKYSKDIQSVRLPRLRNLWVRFTTGEDAWFSKLELPSVLQSYKFYYLFPLPHRVCQKLNMRTESLVAKCHPCREFIPSWLATESGYLRSLTLDAAFQGYKRTMRCLRALQTYKNSQVPCPQLEEVRITHFFRFSEALLKPELGLRRYRNLLSGISSSRVKAGHPPLRFIWGRWGRDMVDLKNKTTTKATKVTNNTGNPESDSDCDLFEYYDLFIQ
jgi:hypothetical protein